DSIPTSANQEDHNSMGSICAQKAWRVLRNTETVLAIELLCAAQGLDFARTMSGETPMKAGTGVEAAFAAIRRSVGRLGDDRVLYHDIQKALRLVTEGTILAGVEARIGPIR
ncbi:MAG: aromatic amino acid lyase, partial [Bacteroidota bacterium]